MNAKTTRGSPLPVAVRQRLSIAVARHGLPLVLQASRASRQAIASALGGLPILPGTEALVRQALDRLESDDLRRSDAEQIGGES